MPRYSVPPLYTDSAGFATNSPGFLDRDTPMEQQPTKQPYLFPQQQQQSMQQTTLPPMQAGSSGSNMGNAYGGLGGIGGGGQQKISLGQIGLTFDSSRQGGGGGGGYNLSTFAEGGSVAQPQAQGLASLGRGQDSMLVHMTPGEVQGLQKLAMSAGGSLTTNPQTGLPEAGFLSSMLPMIAAAAATYFTGGAAAPYAGAIAGGLTGAVTNKENPLMGAIMGGMSGYGMGNVGNALSGMGTDAAAAEAAKSIATAQSSAANPMAGFLTADAVPVPAEMLSRQAAINSGIGQLGSEGGFGKLLGNAADPKTGLLAKGLGGGMGLAKTALPIIAPIGLAAYQSMSNKNPFNPPATDPARFYKTTYNAPKFNPATGRYDPASYGPGSTSSTAYMVGGGGVAAANKMFTTDEPKKNEMEEVSTTQLQRLVEMGTAPQSAAAQKELYARAVTQRAAPSDYDTKYAAEGGLMGLAEGGMVPSYDYYRNLLNGAQQPAQQTAQVSPNAMNDYLTKLNASLQYNPGTPGTPAQTQPTGTPTLDASGGYYGYDAATKSYKYFPGAAPAAPAPTSIPVYAGEMGGGLGENPGYGGGVAPNNPGYELSMMGGNYGSPNNPGYELSMMGGNYEAAAAEAQSLSDQAAQSGDMAAVGGAGNVGAAGGVYGDVGGAGGLDPGGPGSIVGDVGAYGAPEFGPTGGGSSESVDSGGIMAKGGPIHSGLASLQTYAAGGRLLRGPGDGMSDSIPAVIQGDKPQRAALADGEFVVPADVVSHLGNGSTEAGSKRLYAMMDKVRRARTGNPKQGKQINAARFMPA